MRQLIVSPEKEDLIRAVISSMSEKQKRQYLAREARYLGYGGIAAISRISGVSVPTISKGIKEIQNGDLYVLNGRDRREGGGQRKVTEQFKSAMEEKTAQDGVSRETDLRTIVDDALLDCAYGDPSTNKRFTNVTPEKLAKELSEEYDYVVTASSCRRIFIVLKYSRQQNAKLEQVGESHPMRNAQFLYREELLDSCNTNGIPVISCDTKAKVKMGPFAVPGTEWRKPGDPRASLDHDFAYRFRQIYPDGHPDLPDYFMDKAAIAVPYGVYCPSINAGYTSIGISGDTSEFAANSICRWWENLGREHFPNAKELLILVDGGGSNRSGGFLWKESIARAAITMGLDAVQVFHHPPGTSKWNFIEHRLWSMISINWQAKPKTNLETIVGFISNTTTSTGLYVKCDIDYGIYLTEAKKKQQAEENGIAFAEETAEVRFNKIAALEFLHDDATLRKWNYRIVVK